MSDKLYSPNVATKSVEANFLPMLLLRRSSSVPFTALKTALALGKARLLSKPAFNKRAPAIAGALLF
jgi:hypothetical protein